MAKKKDFDLKRLIIASLILVGLYLGWQTFFSDQAIFVEAGGNQAIRLLGRSARYVYNDCPRDVHWDFGSFTLQAGKDDIRLFKMTFHIGKFSEPNNMVKKVYFYDAGDNLLDTDIPTRVGNRWVVTLEVERDKGIEIPANTKWHLRTEADFDLIEGRHIGRRQVFLSLRQAPFLAFANSPIVPSKDIRITRLRGAPKKDYNLNFNCVVAPGQARISVASHDRDPEIDPGLMVGNGERLLAKFNFYATNYDVTVQRLRVGLGTDYTLNVTNTLKEEVYQINLYDGDVLVATGAPEATGANAGTVMFYNEAGLFRVPANGYKRIKFNVVLAQPTNVPGGAATGSDIVALILGRDFRAIGPGVTTITALDGAITGGNVKRLYKTIPTVTVSSPSSSWLTTGEVEVLKVNVAANTEGDLEWTKLELDVALYNTLLTTDSIKVRSGGVDIDTITNSILATGGEGVILLKIPEQITAGTSKTYSIFLDVNSVIGDSYSLVTKLKLDEWQSADPPSNLIIQVSDGDSFVWSDRVGSDNKPHSMRSSDWHNGFFIKVLPSGSEVLEGGKG